MGVLKVWEQSVSFVPFVGVIATFSNSSPSCQRAGHMEKFETLKCRCLSETTVISREESKQASDGADLSRCRLRASGKPQINWGCEQAWSLPFADHVSVPPLFSGERHLWPIFKF